MLQVVVFVLTQHFLRSKYCLLELSWALDQRHKQRTGSQRTAGGVLRLVPLFYRSDDLDLGLPLWDDTRWGARSIQETLQRAHSSADAVQLQQWTQDLASLARLSVPRQDSARRCVLCDESCPVLQPRAM